MVRRLNTKSWLTTLWLLLTIAMSAASAHAEWKLSDIQLAAFDIPLKHAFETSKGSSDSCYGIFVTLTAEDSSTGRSMHGVGSILPRGLVTNETTADAWAGAQVMRTALIGRTLAGSDSTADVQTLRTWVHELDELANAQKLTTPNPPRPGHQLRATLCGYDMALLDLAGRIHNKPICDLLGAGRRTTVERAAPTYNATIQISPLTSRVKRLTTAYHAVRLKVGLDRQRDLDNIMAIAHVLRQDKRLTDNIWIDVNQAWADAPTSIDRLTEIAIGLKSAGFTATFICEQPTKESNLTALADVTHAVRGWHEQYGFNIAVMADEAVWSVDDVKHMVALDAADMVNIKMQKAGGFFGSMDIGDYLAANAPNVGVYVGGIVTSDVAAWANLQLDFALPRLDYQTSAGPHTNLAVNPATAPIEYSRGRTLLRPTSPGLGTDINWPALGQYIKRTWPQASSVPEKAWTPHESSTPEE